VEYTHIVHPIPPLYDEASRILILGSLPSVKSREQCFFYGHPQNRFWRLLARLWEEEAPCTVEEKTRFAHRHHIALWDSIYSCDIRGSSDSSIRNVTPTDLRPILETANIRQIFCNGATSGRYFVKYHEPLLQRTAILLPSTSPANAAFSLDRLAQEWRVVRAIAEDVD